MWTDLRADIEVSRRRLPIPEKEFRPLGLNEWQGLEERMYQQFCHLRHPTARPTWMWTCFKQDTAWVSLEPNETISYLPKLIAANEVVWVVLNETVNGQDKRWFYEGRIQAIQQVLTETTFMDEALLVSKKLDWLLCITHHDDLGATGREMPDKLRALLK